MQNFDDSSTGNGVYAIAKTKSKLAAGGHICRRTGTRCKTTSLGEHPGQVSK